MSQPFVNFRAIVRGLWAKTLLDSPDRRAQESIDRLDNVLQEHQRRHDPRESLVDKLIER